MINSHAPSVSYPVGRSRWQGLLLVGLWLSGAGVALAWAVLASGEGLGAWFGLAALVPSTWGLYIGWHRQPAGCLQWDGQTWLWRSAGGPGDQIVDPPQVQLDLQRLMLIRTSTAAGVPRFLWVDATSDPGHWLDLRRALFARPHNAVSGPPTGRPAQR